MIKLRPEVEFNPHDIDHRTAYNVFLKTGSWGRNAVRFKIKGKPTCNVLAHVEQTLLAYYSNNEFSGS